LARCTVSEHKEFIMVVIRLARAGAKARPFYNIVAADKRERRDGRFIERLGFYNPVAKGQEQSLRLVQDRLTHWLSVGAQPSPTVARLMAQAAKAAKTA
jgi:small subunit ribosomal protein S16